MMRGGGDSLPHADVGAPDREAPHEPRVVDDVVAFSARFPARDTRARLEQRTRGNVDASDADQRVDAARTALVSNDERERAVERPRLLDTIVPELIERDGRTYLLRRLPASSARPANGTRSSSSCSRS